jgi:hypothetical protein
MNRSLIMLSALLVITGCGKSGGGGGKNPNLFDSTWSQEYLKVGKQNQQCASKGNDFISTIMRLNLITSGFTTEKDVEFSPMLQGRRLKDGTSILKTMFNEKSHYDIQLTGEYSFSQVSAPEELELCPDENNYDSGTVESVALNAAYFVSKTHHKFLSVIKDVDVKPITINITPEISKSVIIDRVKYTVYETDNAYYNPMDLSITLLPHSKNHKDEGGVNYWEVPMISSHEYGHHLFQSIYQQDYRTFVKAKCFESAAKATATQEDDQDSARTVTTSNIIASYNEGFADLIAYYTLEKDEGSVSGVRCLEVNRDIGNGYFYFGIQKKFSPSALASFFSKTSEKDIGLGCKYPSFQDEHMIGAIFAYSADQILGLVAKSNEEKLSALIDWTKFLKTTKSSFQYYGLSPESFLKETFKKFVTISATKFNKPYDTTFCAKVESLYPGLGLTECKSLR